jgi:hypothetical protein
LKRAAAAPNVPLLGVWHLKRRGANQVRVWNRDDVLRIEDAGPQAGVLTAISKRDSSH